MFLQHLWTALPFAQWEDTFSYHTKLFRCFLLSFLDAHSELAFVSQSSERILAVLGQRLADVGLHDPVSHRAFPLGRHNDALMRCPPKRYDVTSLPSFVATTPIDHLMAVPPAFVPHPINVTHGLCEEPPYSAVASDLPGSDRVLLGRYDAPFTGVVGCILLWLLTLATVVWHSSSTARARSTTTRTICRHPKMAVDTTTISHEQATPLPQNHLSIEDGTQSLVTRIVEDVDHRASMPGAWLHERRKQNTFETLPEPVFDMMLWSLICSCAQKTGAYFPGPTLIFTASGPSDHGSNDEVTVGRTLEDGGSLMCQGLGSTEVDLDAGIPTPPVLDHLPPESSLSIRNRPGSTTAMCNRREPYTTGDVAIKDLDSAQTTMLDAVREDKIGLTFSLVTSSNADRVLYQEDISSDGDESASENRTDGTEDEDLFGIGTQHPGISPLERENEYRVLDQQQDGASSDTGCPLSLRRARSTGYLWRKRDIFGDGDDSYWTEQVNARMSGARPCRYGWTDVSRRPREGREDETDNWPTRNSQVTHVTVPEKTSDMQTNSNSTKLRRYSSPPLNVDASLSDRAGSDGEPPGVYVVPQKRGRMMGGRCWSPVSSPRPTDHPSGLGFFPFRKTPSLLTPEAWRPGCLYIPDPPVDESSQADAWWDSLSSVGSCGIGHMFDAGAVNQDVPERGPPSSQDPQGAQVSWRDRYENDPASRRFNAVHRRATTEG